MANNGTPVNDLILTVTKDVELKKSAAKGTPYLKMNAVHEDSGEKTWFTAMAFKAMANNLSSLVKKGTKMKVSGNVSQKEYQKKDGTVGIENVVMINTAKVVTSDGVVNVDEFYEPKKEESPF